MDRDVTVGFEQVAQPLVEAAAVHVGRLAHPLSDSEDVVELGGHGDEAYGWPRATATAAAHHLRTRALMPVDDELRFGQLGPSSRPPCV